MEGLYAIKTKKLVKLSVEQIVDCDGTFGTETESNCGVYGGWPYLAFEFINSIVRVSVYYPLKLTVITMLKILKGRD